MKNGRRREATEAEGERGGGGGGGGGGGEDEGNARQKEPTFPTLFHLQLCSGARYSNRRSPLFDVP